MFTVIGRYINREVLLSWLAVTSALLVILMSHRFAGFLGSAASGEIPPHSVWPLVGLSTVQYLVIIVPVAFFLSVLLALGRLYKDSEMAAMMACGVGPLHLYKALVWIAVPVMAGVAVLSLQAAPAATQTMNEVQETARAEARLSVFEPGAFRNLEGADGVFYAERRANGELEGVFIQGTEGDERVLIRAQRAWLEAEPDGPRYLVLERGYRYELIPGEAQLQRTRFERHGLRLPEARVDAGADEREARSVSELLSSGRAEDMAEFHWRLSMPIGGLVLTLLAVPLAKTKPRQGRYSRLFIGIVVYLVYSNLLATGQVWLERGQLPMAMGLWWVHGLFLLVAGILLMQQTGGYRRWLQRGGEQGA
ncbi:LPS export ABC transporter permease LptF [Gammaproteobacteria bacterium AB-CW1]|uniref:Lipopolysaccharide export system permease protein LptF n=1 Tax=Natronospira elongata TaxID=3110268 RepID=A0AAP6JHF1_9GAMM|nr:LPS export ABC transporter permease LptF [Gammaproteobacteria bacterium AB-CW1]